MHYNNDEQKIEYLNRLWQKTYFDDVIERYGIKNANALEGLVQMAVDGYRSGRCYGTGVMRCRNAIGRSVGTA